jgi:glutamyl/glutaminyl-tRNA synthetase
VYVAFFSDITHTVELIQAGHRVTLTYNLFLMDKDAHPHVTHVIPSPEQALEATLHRLLANLLFLPGGGYLVYRLSHQCPMLPPSQLKWVDGKRQAPPNQLRLVLQLLKGSDAHVHTVSERMGLPTNVKIFYDSGEGYDGDGHDVLVNDVLNTEDVNEYFEMSLRDKIEKMGVILKHGEKRKRKLNKRSQTAYDKEDEEAPNTVTVHWVNKITKHNRVSSNYVVYGNEASIGHVYGNGALFVKVPAFGQGIRN